MVTRVICDKRRVSLFEPGVADGENIGHGEFQNCVTFLITRTKSVPTVDITVHTDNSTDVTVPVTDWDDYVSGWDFGNSILQLNLGQGYIIMTPNNYECIYFLISLYLITFVSNPMNIAKCHIIHLSTGVNHQTA